jgi:hypothetical protein
MSKIDLKKELKHLYNPSAKKVVEVDVPAMNYIMVDGQGDPSTSPDFQGAFEVLYGLAFTTKFYIKQNNLGPDYTVMPAEGLWWADDMNVFTQGERDQWKWTIMLLQPDFVQKEHLDTAVQQLKKKKNLPAIDRWRFEPYQEGLSAQTMHIGPYAEEEPTIRRIHQYIEERGGRLSGKHHEIYLSDPRRSAPEKMKTVIRQPFTLD